MSVNASTTAAQFIAVLLPQLPDRRTPADTPVKTMLQIISVLQHSFGLLKVSCIQALPCELAIRRRLNHNALLLPRIRFPDALVHVQLG